VSSIGDIYGKYERNEKHLQSKKRKKATAFEIVSAQ
jgi:hypothetical protein